MYCGDTDKSIARMAHSVMTHGTQRLLLAHEMPGADDGEARNAVMFDTFFAGDLNGGTPDRLLRCGIYHAIANTLKGGVLRPVSMFILAQALAKEVATGEGDLGGASTGAVLTTASPQSTEVFFVDRAVRQLCHYRQST